MTPDIEKMVQDEAQILFDKFNSVWNWRELANDQKVKWTQVAKHVLKERLLARVDALCHIFPDLNSDSGITIQKGSSKDWALKYVLELQSQLEELEKI